MCYLILTFIKIMFLFYISTIYDFSYSPKGEVEYLSKISAPMDIGDDEFHLYLLYDEMKVTLVKEFFIYDGIDMVMAVGGILAFFLGFSLLSVLLDCVDVISRACGHDHDDDIKINAFKRTFRQ